MPLYKAMVPPYLEYCMPFWLPYRKKNIEEMGKVQNRANEMTRRLEHLSCVHMTRGIYVPAIADNESWPYWDMATIKPYFVHTHKILLFNIICFETWVVMLSLKQAWVY